MNPINTTNAPEAIGPYSQAQSGSNLFFCSGQIPLNPETMQVEGSDIISHTKQVFRNIKAVLNAGGLTLNDVIKTTVFLSDMNNFTEMNKVYADEFKKHKPARSTVEVSRLPKDVLLEIECIAINNT